MRWLLIKVLHINSYSTEPIDSFCAKDFSVENPILSWDVSEHVYQDSRPYLFIQMSLVRKLDKVIVQSEV